MNFIQYPFAILMAFSLVFVVEAEAKHGSEKARSRVLKEISKNESLKTKSAIVKDEQS